MTSIYFLPSAALRLLQTQPAYQPAGANSHAQSRCSGMLGLGGKTYKWAFRCGKIIPKRILGGATACIVHQRKLPITKLQTRSEGLYLSTAAVQADQAKPSKACFLMFFWLMCFLGGFGVLDVFCLLIFRFLGVRYLDLCQHPTVGDALRNTTTWSSGTSSWLTGMLHNPRCADSRQPDKINKEEHQGKKNLPRPSKGCFWEAF